MTRPSSHGGRRLCPNTAVTWTWTDGVWVQADWRCGSATAGRQSQRLAHCCATFCQRSFVGLVRGVFCKRGYHFGQSGSKRYEKQKGAYGGKLT